MRWAGNYRRQGDAALPEVADRRVVLMLTPTSFIVDGVEDAEKDKSKDKPSNNERRDCHYYLFIPRMLYEPFKDFFHVVMAFFIFNHPNIHCRLHHAVEVSSIE